ncbi:hypothetical protein DICPUDRAFT_6126, partial [Dictyostelium purpureum]
KVKKVKHIKLSNALDQAPEKDNKQISNITSEVIAITSKEDNSIFIYDLRNGVLLATFNSSSSEPNGFCVVGNEYFATSQSQKPMIHLYSWKKDQPIYKTPLQEKSGPICSSSDGSYVAMGTPSGVVYLWEVATGTLLRMWEAHYNKISCLTFTKDDFYLITAGDDGIINCWSFDHILDREVSLIRAKNSFSDHSLGITSLYSGFGGSNSRLFSASLDRTVKIWDMVTGACINSIIFPTFLTSIVLDSTETTLYVGGGNGIIYQIDLIQLNSGSLLNNSIANNSNNNSINEKSFTSEIDNNNNKRKTFTGHTKAISSLSLSIDGSLLISGSIDGVCNIWDTFSRQTVRSIANTIKGGISSLFVMMNPIDQLNFNANGIVDNKKLMDPLQPFEKYSANTIERTSVPMKLKDIQVDNHLDYLPTVSNLQIRIESTQSTNDEIINITNQETNSKINELNNTIQDYEKQVAQLKKNIEALTKNNENLKLTNEKLTNQFIQFKQQQESITNKNKNKKQQQQQQQQQPKKEILEDEDDLEIIEDQAEIKRKEPK